MLDRTAQQRDWGLITEGELMKLSREEQARYHVWLLNQWSNQAWSRAQSDYQSDWTEAQANQDWTAS